MSWINDDIVGVVEIHGAKKGWKLYEHVRSFIPIFMSKQSHYRPFYACIHYSLPEVDDPTHFAIQAANAAKDTTDRIKDARAPTMTRDIEKPRLLPVGK